MKANNNNIKISHMYEPYSGPAGPTKEQAENNTLALGEMLKALNIPFIEDREWAQLRWGGDDLNLAIKKGNEIIVTGYDRWGYVVESDNFVNIDVDQLGLDETITAIQNWYNS